MTTPPAAAIVSPDELDDFLQLGGQINTASAGTAIRWASGLLMGATAFTEWPDPVPDPLWSWALELAGIGYDNPTAMTEQQVGDERSAWYMARRREIVADAAARYPRGGVPQWSFPPAEPWPF